jgi:excisionase family DNA binding protein
MSRVSGLTRISADTSGLAGYRSGSMSDLVLYTANEVADLLRLHHQVVQRKLQAGEIPGYRIGREWRVERSQLLAWLEQHSNQQPAQQRSPQPAHEWFEAGGRLRALPAQRSKRRGVLERIAAAFEAGRTYREAEVNAVLRAFPNDVATVRRELVAEKMLVRTAAGIYKRAAPREPAVRRA